MRKKFATRNSTGNHFYWPLIKQLTKTLNKGEPICSDNLPRKPKRFSKKSYCDWWKRHMDKDKRNVRVKNRFDLMKGCRSKRLTKNTSSLRNYFQSIRGHTDQNLGHRFNHHTYEKVRCFPFLFLPSPWRKSLCYIYAQMHNSKRRCTYAEFQVSW